MPRTLTDIPVGGYLSHEFDFATLLNRLGAQQVIQDEIVTPLADAELGNGTFVCVTIIGHSDRNDTAGLSTEDRKLDELRSSQLRAESAEEFIFNAFADLVLQQGGVVPADTASMQNGGIFITPAGAGNLVHLVPGNDETKRQDNRRVQFLIGRFSP